MVDCSSHLAGHNAHWIQRRVRNDPQRPPIPGRARMVGDVVEFTADDGGGPIRLHNHDPERVRKYIQAGDRCDYIEGCSLLRFDERPTEIDIGTVYVTSPCVSVSRNDPGPCWSRPDPSV